MRPDEDLRLHHWLYISRCVVEPAWTAAMVDSLVAHAMGRNASVGLTGALLFTGTHFLQALEGPPTALALMRAAIGEDRRHTALVTLDEGSIPERRFADGLWPMPADRSTSQTRCAGPWTGRPR
jgi:hypothetical protein